MKNISEIIDGMNQYRTDKEIQQNDFDVQSTYLPIEELPEGVYEARYYAYTFELRDGRLFKTKIGVKRSRRMTGFEKYYVKDGDFRHIQ